MSGSRLTFGIYPGSALGGVELVAQHHSRSGDVAGFCAFVEDLVGLHSEHLATLQVCEGPNVTGDPALDGAYPRVAEAIVAGVKTAKQATKRSGRDIKVGYIHHALRDARSDGSGLFCRFGLMTDDYTPKPAFHVYRDLIARY